MSNEKFGKPIHFFLSSYFLNEYKEQERSVRLIVISDKYKGIALFAKSHAAKYTKLMRKFVFAGLSASIYNDPLKKEQEMNTLVGQQHLDLLKKVLVFR